MQLSVESIDSLHSNPRGQVSPPSQSKTQCPNGFSGLGSWKKKQPACAVPLSGAGQSLSTWHG
jgi:hypothetical protein